MTYAETFQKLKTAESTGAMYVTAEVDEGTVTVPLEDALQHWESLAPGESFRVHLVHYSDHCIAQEFAR